MTRFAITHSIIYIGSDKRRKNMGPTTACFLRANDEKISCYSFRIPHPTVDIRHDSCMTKFNFFVINKMRPLIDTPLNVSLIDIYFIIAYKLIRDIFWIRNINYIRIHICIRLIFNSYSYLFNIQSVFISA